MRRSTFALASALGLALLAPRAVRAEDCTKQRPTDGPNGYQGYAYGADPYASFGTSRVLVWYATGGKNAPNLSSTRMDGVPDMVATVAQVADEALAKFEQLGFKKPLSDGSFPACASNGGDGRMDVYLVDFTGADGLTVGEQCATAASGARQCPSFVLAHRRIDSQYGSALRGARTVVAHELFHAVQNAYDQGMDRFWAEGTAQWAAAQLDPKLGDLERNLPAFFENAKRSIDVTTGGVTAGYLYGAAIWPVFLTETQGLDVVREILEHQAATADPAMASAGAVLEGYGTTLSAAYTTFGAWNASTGSRAGTGGYARAAEYPEVALEAFPQDGASGVLAGYGNRYYLVQLDGAKQLSLEADAARVNAMIVPLEGGKARVDQAKFLPANVTGDALLVVVGTSASKADAPFTVKVGEPGPRGPTNPPMRQSGGCAATPSAPAGDGALLAGLAALVLAARRRRRGATT
jgi:hypothetical protein